MGVPKIYIQKHLLEEEYFLLGHRRYVKIDNLIEF